MTILFLKIETGIFFDLIFWAAFLYALFRPLGKKLAEFLRTMKGVIKEFVYMVEDIVEKKKSL